MWCQALQRWMRPRILHYSHLSFDCSPRARQILLQSGTYCPKTIGDTTIGTSDLIFLVISPLLPQGAIDAKKHVYTNWDKYFSYPLILNVTFTPFTSDTLSRQSCSMISASQKPQVYSSVFFCWHHEFAQLGCLLILFDLYIESLSTVLSFLSRKMRRYERSLYQFTELFCAKIIIDWAVSIDRFYTKSTANMCHHPPTLAALFHSHRMQTLAPKRCWSHYWNKSHHRDLAHLHFPSMHS